MIAVLIVGGNWNNGTNAGLWYWNGNNGASNANSNIGGRICCKILLWIAFPCHLAENNRKEHGLVGLRH